MAIAKTNARTELRLNDLDWELLSIMADGKRYTPAYLYNDVPELDQHTGHWIRQRIGHLHEHGLIEKVGTSSMYVITDWGHSALDLRDEISDEDPPQDLMKRIIQHSESGGADE